MRYHLKLGHARAPTGGHRFPIGDMFLRATTAEELLVLIEKYRSENSDPLGDPVQDLGEYYAAIAPHLVRVVIDEDPPPRPEGVELAELMNKIWKLHPRFMEQGPIAEIRMKHCRGCPFWDEKKTVSMIGLYASRATARTRLLLSDQDLEEEGYCKSWKLPLKLFNRMTDPDHVFELPKSLKQCWVGKL